MNKRKTMSAIIIDVREPYEFSAGHAKGALNIPPAELIQGIPPALKNTPKDTTLVLYCRSGSRSNTSMHILRGYGFTDLVNGINQHQVEANYLQ